MANEFKGTISFPWGDADVQVLATATGAQALTIVNGLTIIDGVTVPGTADRTLNLTIDPELPIGAMILVKVQENGGTFHTIFGTGIDSADIVGVDAKIMTQAFIFDGVAFLPTGAKQQIN